MASAVLRKRDLNERMGSLSDCGFLAVLLLNDEFVILEALLYSYGLLICVTLPCTVATGVYTMYASHIYYIAQ